MTDRHPAALADRVTSLESKFEVSTKVLEAKIDAFVQQMKEALKKIDDQKVELRRYLVLERISIAIGFTCLGAVLTYSFKSIFN